MVSVIIPVYNAVSFVEEAVLSAVTQESVLEVLLIDDGSTDGSFEVINNMAQKFSIIRVLTHANRANKGAGASRNLGIQQAKGKWIAFLDADDYYLPGRFNILSSGDTTPEEYDGLGESIGTKFEDEKSKLNFLQHNNLSPNAYSSNDITAGLKKEVASENLFDVLLSGTWGYIHLNGFMIKRSCLNERLFFNDWELSEDTIFILRIAEACKIKVIINNIIAIRRVHSNNRWTASMDKRMFYYRLFILELFSTFDLKGLKNSTLRKIFTLRVKLQYLNYTKCTSKMCKIAYVIKSILVLLFTEPQIFRYVFMAHFFSSALSQK